MKRARIAVVGFPQAQMLDVAGPLEVFARTTRWLEEERVRTRGPAYDVELIAARRGALPMSSGVALVAARAYSDVAGGLDTLLVAGGAGTRAACEDRALLAWLRRMAARTRRI